MERGSDKHSPIVDEEMEKEMTGYLQGGHPTHADEDKDVEPPADDDPAAQYPDRPELGHQHET